MKYFSPTIRSILTLCFFTVLFYFPLIFQQKMYTAQDWGRGDLTHFNYPLHHIYGNTVKQFSFPFWTDDVYGGFQLGAEGQVGMFYLPNLILFSLLPNYTAYALSFVVISLLATLGTYWYSRQLRLNHLSSIFAAITFSFSMFFAGHFVHLNMVQAFSLIPLFFFFIEYSIAKRFRWFSFLALSLLQTQMFFTGHPQIALYTATVLVIYTYFRSERKQRIKNTLITISAIICGTLMAMIQLLPTWELSKLSPSSELESAESSMFLFPYTLRDLLYFILPSPFGNPANNTYSILLKDGIYWENNTYSGIIAFICVLGLLFRKGKNELRLFSLLFLSIILFSMGWLYIFYYLPPFSLFRLPQRGLILGLFFFSILSAYGFSFLTNHLNNYSRRITLFLLFSIIGLHFFTLWQSNHFYNNPIAKNDWLGVPETATYLKKEEGRIYAIGGVLLWEKVYTEIAHGWSGKGGEQLIATKALLDPNRNATYDIPSLDGYAKLVPLRTLAYLSLIRKGVTETNKAITISSTSAKLLGSANVKSIVTAKPITNPDFNEKASFTDPTIKTTFHIYDNPYYQPFIRSAVTLTELPKTGNVEAEHLITSSSDWHRSVSGEEKQRMKTFSHDVEIRKKHLTPQELHFSVKTERLPALIVVAQSYDQNWQLTIDGKKQPIFPVNINSQGMIIPPGNHEIIVRYVPEWFIKGGYISMVGVIVTLGCSLFIAKYGLAK